MHHIKYHKSNQGIEDEEEIKREIDFMLETLGIEEKRHERSMSLSGGMKRKLRYTFKIKLIWLKLNRESFNLQGDTKMFTSRFFIFSVLVLQ